MNEYELKQQIKRNRLEQAAERARGESQSAIRAAHAVVEAIPFGQPILVGHHSEGKHRRALKRHDSKMRAAIEADKRAKALAEKAAAVGAGGISVHDPEAVAKLRAELAAAKAEQGRMKAANAAIRKHAKAGTDAQVAALARIGIGDTLARALLKPDFAGRIGFPSYQLTNNGATIRRIEQRIAEVATAQEAEAVESQHGAITYREEDCRILLVFPGKPPEAIRQSLRARAFKWSPTRGAWVRQLTNAARYAAQQVIADAAKLEGAA